MEYRIADDSDLDLLAEWNHQLIHDEGHRNSMTVQELRERMKVWLSGEYKAIIFEKTPSPWLMPFTERMRRRFTFGSFSSHKITGERGSAETPWRLYATKYGLNTNG